MTALACAASRHHNGVSRIHGEVSANICSYLWPQILPHENPMDYVTNGVHLPTFLAPNGSDLRALPRHRLAGTADRARQLARHRRHPGRHLLSIRQQLKSNCCKLVRERIQRAAPPQPGFAVASRPPAQVCRPDNPNILTIGFAPPFCHLQAGRPALPGPDWLREIITQAGRPVLFLFAGKAHPADQPGRNHPPIAHWAKQPEFEGASCSSRAATCICRARWSPASMSGSTTRSTRWKPGHLGHEGGR